ncbi:MAG: energy-coupling factor transporter ATPase [Desulfobacterales bacterium]
MHEPHQHITRPVYDTPLFGARRLYYCYPDKTLALSDINIDIAAGERIALVGQNGSGKTTLVKQLCGLLSPTSGEVFYKEKPLEGEHLEKSRLKIGMLFQDPDDQLFGHTLLEDTAFGPRNQGLLRQDADHAALDALKRVNLIDMAYKAPHNLSFGQKKRAALAGLLAMQPDVLFLDEPTANLDPRQEQVFLDLLKDFSGTLICISHDLIFLYELCNRAVVLDKGRVHHDYTMSELVSQKQSLRMHGLDFSFRLVISDSIPEKTNTTLKSSSFEIINNNQLVAFRDYQYRYPDGTLALSNIDFTICEKEKISIVGENGAGKTTLLSCLLGLLEGGGDFYFAGSLVKPGQRKTLWRQIGMVFQDCADQLFCPSVKEEIEFGLIELGCSRTESEKRIKDVLALVHMEGFEERVPLHLSGGERKRLALACVLAMNPKLLILDEPTAGLDPQGEELLLSILSDLDTTLLLVSHDIFFIKKLTKRTIVMHKGRIIEDMPIKAFLEDERLGSLNGLSYSYRDKSSSTILRLQHEHEHRHIHKHLHIQPQLHAYAADYDLYEHTHDHSHHFVHSHPGEEKEHDHTTHHDHDHYHPEHDKKKTNRLLQKTR